MKWIAGMAVAMTAVALVYLGSGPTRSPPHVHGGSIRIVAGVDRPMAMPVVARPGTIVLTSMVAPSRQPEETTVARTDTEALAELFDTQARDPAWATAAEAEVRSHMPAGSDVRCAEFMCRIAMPLPDRSMAASADQQADAASRRWSTDLSYNRLTATIVSDRQVPTLIFYVTRSAEGSEVMGSPRPLARRSAVGGRRSLAEVMIYPSMDGSRKVCLSVQAGDDRGAS